MYRTDFSNSTRVNIDMWYVGEVTIDVSRINIPHRASIFISRRTISTTKLNITGAFSNLGTESTVVDCIPNRGYYFTLHLVKSADGALAFVTKL